MTETPAENPSTSRNSDLRSGFVIGGGLVLATALAWASTSGLGITTGPTPEGDRDAAASSYPSAPAAGALTAASPRPRVVVLPGIVSAEADGMAGFEAILRLHSWLGLRDLDTGRAELVWTPALRTDEVDAVVVEDCAAAADPVGESRVLRSPPLPPVDAPPPPVFIRVALQDDPRGMRLEGFVCSPGGRIHRQVVRDSRERLGRAQRELLTWLATRLEISDTTSWEVDWGRDPAPAGPFRRGYALALRSSMNEAGVPPTSLSDAAVELAEASWLAGALSEAQAEREGHFRRAAALRVGFTAALEDLAASRLSRDRVDLARAALARLRRPAPGARPTEWSLAYAALEAGDAEGAAGLLETLPPWLIATEETAALQANVLHDLGEHERALRWADAWVAADERAGRARFVRGRVLEALERRPEAAEAYAAAELDPDLRDAALQRWVVMQVLTDQGHEVARALTDDTVSESPGLRELRAFAAHRARSPADAFRDYDVLAELQPQDPRHRVNRCVTALAAGLVPSDPDPCRGLPPGTLEKDLLRSAAISRLPNRTVEQFLELMDRSERAGRSAPLDPIAADAMLEVVGPFRTEEERARLQGTWRLAVGGERRLTASDEPEAGTEELGAARFSGE